MLVNNTSLKTLYGQGTCPYGWNDKFGPHPKTLFCSSTEDSHVVFSKQLTEYEREAWGKAVDSQAWDKEAGEYNLQVVAQIVRDISGAEVVAFEKF